MKQNKKKMTALTFALGTCVFVSTALADVLLGSGYDRLKESAKTTANQMEKGMNNFTVEMLFTLKDNDTTLLQGTTHQKMDTTKRMAESSTITEYASGHSTNTYSYSDPKLDIWKSGQENKYYVTEYPEDANRGALNQFTSPFNEQGAPEIEKIIDAVVGNLKDYVQAEERPDGGKVYSGSLSATQVPAIVNAVSSFGIKQMIRDQNRMEEDHLKMEEIESDIYVKKVTGTAIENKAGLLEHVTGDVVLSGKDKKGVQHDLTLRAVFNLSDIGSTKLSKPNLNGAKVEKVSPFGGLTNRFVGTYKNNIVLEKDGSFVKIGERSLVITSVEDGMVKGTYTESVKPGFEGDYPEAYNFSFQYKQKDYNSMFTYTNSKGEQQKGRINPSNPGKVYLDLEIEMMDENSWRSNQRSNFDQEFNRVFED